MPMHNLIECNDSYLKASGSLWHCYRDEPSLDNNSNIADFTSANHNNKSIKYKPKMMTEQVKQMMTVTKLLK